MHPFQKSAEYFGISVHNVILFRKILAACNIKLTEYFNVIFWSLNQNLSRLNI